MTPSAPGARLAGKLGLTDRVFAGSAIPPAAGRPSRPASNASTAASSASCGSTDALADATSRYLYEAGGKRVRPMLALLTAQLGDGATDDVIEGATALEMTHLGSLYHDDVMDAADKRRGVPSAHAVWGNSIAILTGDLLFSRASQIMARHGDRAIRLQADTFERLVLGQMHETVGPQQGEDPVAFYLQVLSDKTGSLIAAAAQAGRDLLQRAAASSRSPIVDVRREGGRRLPAARRRHRPVGRPRRDRQGARHRPARGRADDAVPRARTAHGCRIRRPARPHRRGRRPHRGRRRPGDPRRRRSPSCASTRRPSATLDLAHAWSRDAVDALAPLPDGPVREALTRFAQAVADRSS